MYNDRRPKDVFYYFQAFLRKDIPVLHIAVDDWKYRTVVSDGEAVEHPVKVYSNLDRVELSVNRKNSLYKVLRIAMLGGGYLLLWEKHACSIRHLSREEGGAGFGCFRKDTASPYRSSQY